MVYNYGDRISWLNDIPVISSFCGSAGATTSQCFGASAVLRVSLALVVFFACQFFLAFAADAFVGCWGMKVALWLVLLVGCMFVPSDSLTKYAQVTRAAAIAFMLAMVIIVLDFAYHMQEVLAERMDRSDRDTEAAGAQPGCCSNCWRTLYLTLSIVATIAALTGIGILYHFSTTRPGGELCSNNTAFLSVTLVAGILFMVMSPLEFFGGRGILTPALIFLYSA